MYHPAAALHQPSLKTTLIADFAALKKVIEEAKQVKVNLPEPVQPTVFGNDDIKTEEPPAEQLSLF
jgi:hypothetical protein